MHSKSRCMPADLGDTEEQSLPCYLFPCPSLHPATPPQMPQLSFSAVTGPPSIQRNYFCPSLVSSGGACRGLCQTSEGSQARSPSCHLHSAVTPVPTGSAEEGSAEGAAACHRAEPPLPAPLHRVSGTARHPERQVACPGPPRPQQTQSRLSPRWATGG